MPYADPEKQRRVSRGRHNRLYRHDPEWREKEKERQRALYRKNIEKVRARAREYQRKKRAEEKAALNKGKPPLR